jgi:hypothetical protein
MRIHPTAVFLWTKADYIDEQGNPIEPKKERPPLASLIFHQPFFPYLSTVVVRRDLFIEMGGFNTRLRCAEDVELFAKIARRFPISLVPQTLARYRCHHTQLHKSVRSRLESWPILFEFLSDLWRDEAEKQVALGEFAAAVNTSIGKHLLRAGNYQAARVHFSRSFFQKALLFEKSSALGVVVFTRCSKPLSPSEKTCGATVTGGEHPYRRQARALGEVSSERVLLLAEFYFAKRKRQHSAIASRIIDPVILDLPLLRP